MFRRYQRPIFNYVYRMSGDIAASEDLTQEVFLRVFTALDRAGDIANCRAWLYRIATNVTISHLRKGRHPATSLDALIVNRPLAEQSGPMAALPEETQIRREAVDEAVRALLRLSVSHRQVLVLRQLQGLSYQELSQVTGLSVDAVTSLLYRARQEFRRQLMVAARPAGAERRREGQSDEL